MTEKKYNVLYVNSVFDYGKSVSGGYILYKILSKVNNINLTVLPTGNPTKHPIDSSHFLPYVPNAIKMSSAELIDIIPEHDILFLAAEDLTNPQIFDICTHFNSKFVTISMSNWLFGNTSHYPELDNDFTGNRANDRLSLYNKLNAQIVVGSSHSLNVMKASIFQNVNHTLIPLPFEEIEVYDGVVNKNTNKKIILWGTNQPTNPRKGKVYFENILSHLYKIVGNPNEILIHYVGPPTPLNSKFEVVYLGKMPNRTELSKCYKGSDVFALTTLADAGPMMATECLKNETPIVSFNTNISVDYILNGKNGHIVNGTEEFAQKLYDVLYHNDYNMDLEYVRKFNSEAIVVSKYEKMFDKIMM